MPTGTLLHQLCRIGVAPVITIDNAADALPLADALLEGGLPIVEITFRTPEAADVIRAISTERPQMIVGAGTILTPDSLQAAYASGAAFAVAPGLNSRIVEQAMKLGLPFFPGVATPTEIEAGLALGCPLLKFFPAEALGGVPMIEALSASYQHAGLHLMPTGGVNIGNLESYLKLAVVAAVGGAWVAPRDDVKNRRWDEISKRCKAAVEIVKKVKNPA